jgi:hypothetical protein
MIIRAHPPVMRALFYECHPRERASVLATSVTGGSVASRGPCSPPKNILATNSTTTTIAIDPKHLHPAWCAGIGRPVSHGCLL